MASRNSASDLSESDFRLIGLFKGQIMLAYIMFETLLQENGVYEELFQAAKALL